LTRTAKAHRARAAERIIRDAYGITRVETARRAVRYELLGTHVAVAIVRDHRNGGRTAVRVACRLTDGRAVQMRKESRTHFSTVKDFLAYFDDMYARFGAPNG
jgi:hypothetical protein